jgi:hypothetical protein
MHRIARSFVVFNSVEPVVFVMTEIQLVAMILEWFAGHHAMGHAAQSLCVTLCDVSFQVATPNSAVSLESCNVYHTGYRVSFQVC